MTPWTMLPSTGQRLVTLGEVSLTELAADDDEEKRRIIFGTIPRVDGIDASPDPLLELRSVIYFLSGRRRRAQLGNPFAAAPETKQIDGQHAEYAGVKGDPEPEIRMHDPSPRDVKIALVMMKRAYPGGYALNASACFPHYLKKQITDFRPTDKYE
jgi:hypothetical protein